MKYYLILTVSLFMLASIQARTFLLEIFENPAPLYQSVRLLILDEKQNAQLVWNDIQQQIGKSLFELNKNLNSLHKYDEVLNKKLNEIKNLLHSQNIRTCYNRYEREIARFSRDFLQNFSICKQTLSSKLLQVKNDLTPNMKYIQNASLQIQEVKYVCNMTDLKRNETESHHASIILCLLANLGEINQRLEEAAQVIRNIFTRMIFNLEEKKSVYNDTILVRIDGRNYNACLDFKDLKDEFEMIYDNVKMCVKEINS